MDAKDASINGYQEIMNSQEYAPNAKARIGTDQKTKNQAVIMNSTHKLIIGSSTSLKEIKERKIPVHLVVTSPPYPMIEMWDKQFSGLGAKTYEEMHALLAKTWKECFDILVEGGLLCINIGDAARKNDGNGFRLYPNHSKIIEHCEKIGFTTLPYILWKKPTNKPNAFLGSGFIPPNAYVTLDCEYILIFRKGQMRKFPPKDKVRYESAFSRQERDEWFSQVWEDIRGTKQNHADIKRRTAAFPEEIARRLISMFSVKGDTVLDPFVGTGTTMKVAKELGRNSIGYEIDESIEKIITDSMKQATLNSDFVFEKISRF